jgi:hypothetical protein
MALGQWQNPESDQLRMPFLKMLFWAYFLLLIFEGALRKWIFPEYSAPLLLVRDPVGLLIIFGAFSTNKWPERWTLAAGILTAGLLGLCAIQVFFGNNPWVAALYGLRSYLLPFPVAFIMGQNLDAEDLRKFGVCTLWLLLPETALEVFQYLLPGSILNVGAYKGAAQIGYLGGHVRASGTFSFVVGPAFYGPLAAAFILYGFVSEGFAKKWLLWVATFALILSVPVVGSRTLIFELGAVAAGAGVAALCGVSQFFKLSKIGVPLVAVFVLVTYLPVFSAASSTLSERWQMANQGEGGTVRRVLVHRTASSLMYTIENTDFSRNPTGIGMGRTSAAAEALLKSRVPIHAGEDELSRLLVEFGLFPSLAYVLFCILLGLIIFVRAFFRARHGAPLALLLAPLVVSALLASNLEQPTDQGFMVIFLAFSLAALTPAEPGRALRAPFSSARHLPARPRVRPYSG